jgi:DNA mismatch repair endonuclease MutH
MMNLNEDYDKKNPISIESYAQKLLGKSFQEVITEDVYRQSLMIHEDKNIYGIAIDNESKRNKGNLGQIIEAKFFHYACNSDSRPDFPEAGVELKVTPYKINPNGKIVAKERLILTMIDYLSVVNEKFETSHLWNKSKLILLIYYLYTKEVKFNVDYHIQYAKLFTPPEQDIKIIKHDFDIIVGKIQAGKAHELSEGDTLYLGAATKAATSADRRSQPYSHEMAKPRAFSFKNSYMTYVLNNYIIPGKNTYEAILKDTSVESFEDYVTEKINKYCGYTVDELCDKFQIANERVPKNLEAILAYRILGIKGNHAEEFEKANIVVKTIRIGKNNKIKESMSFPTFKFKELIEEKWEDSILGTYLEQTRFLFVVYKFNDQDELVLKGCQFWNIPYNDLHSEVHKVWKQTQNVIREGLQIQVRNGKNYNNLPGSSNNSVCHVRPHAQNAKDTYELPDGRQYPKQCFWLNNTYILSQLDKRFFEK